MLIIEGPDNAGKTTLANYLSQELGIPIHHFGAPPENFTQLLSRVIFCMNNKDHFIYDRIPLVSEHVYSILRNRNLIHELYNNGEQHYKDLRETNPILIYCRPPVKKMLEGHKGKEHDTQEHLDFVRDNAQKLIDRYDQLMDDEHMPPYWVFDYTEQSRENILEQVKEAIKERGQFNYFLEKENSVKGNLINDVYNFQTKILGLDFPDKPMLIKDDRKTQAIEKLDEELQEFVDATSISEQADALIDLMYFALGELHQAGIDTQRVWDSVHAANMNKIIGMTKRGHVNDARKPDDWTAPDHTWLDK